MPPFPLPLTPFEFAMLADDRPSHPMTFTLRLQFEGRLDPPDFREAARRALEGHPLLRALIRGATATRPGGVTWVDAGPREPPVTWLPADAPEPAESGDPIDLVTQTGWRAWIREGFAGSLMVAQFHHACCDGLGALQFLEAALRQLDHATSPPPDLAWLRRRGRSGARWTCHLRRAPHDLRRVFDFFRTAPRPLQPGPSPPAPAPAAPQWHARTLGESETGRLCAGARRADATVNDLLLRDLFVALEDWDGGPPSSAAGRALRIAVPTSLRDPLDPPASAANVMSMAFLDRRPGRPACRRGLLAGLRSEMREIRRQRSGLAMLMALRALAAFPGGVAALYPGDRCLATAVFSNLGIVFASSPLAGPDGLVRAGGATLTGIELFPPVRPLTQAAFGAACYANRLSLSLNSDPVALSGADADRLLGGFVRAVRECSLAQGRSPGRATGLRSDLDGGDEATG